MRSGKKDPMVTKLQRKQKKKHGRGKSGSDDFSEIPQTNSLSCKVEPVGTASALPLAAPNYVEIIELGNFRPILAR